MMMQSDSYGSMRQQEGYVLLAALMLVVLLTMAGLTALFVTGQDAPGVSAMKENNVAQQLADASADLVMSWFHDPAAAPPAVAGLLTKRQGDLASGPSFFDAVGRSQFTGTLDRPDLWLDASRPADDQTLNHATSGSIGSLRSLGRILSVKLYGPLQPGLLGTLEVTSSTADRRAVARTVQLQLGTVSIPPIRAAVQVGQALGNLQRDGESPVLAHWGDHRVLGDLVVKRVDDVVVQNETASVTGHRYDQMLHAEDRWAEYWIGGAIMVTSPPPGQGANPPMPQNVHVHQQPVPGVRLDRWDYDSIKKTAVHWGTYYRLDSLGQLHPLGSAESDQGLTASEALESQVVGDHRGLVFIDTIDGEAPRADNMGTLLLDTDYVESLLVVQGHVVLKPRAAGKSVSVLSPPPPGTQSLGTRVPVQLSGVHLNGLLVAAGRIRIERPLHIYGALITGDSIMGTGPGMVAEVWYNADLAQGLFRGVPVVFRAPGTWLAKY
jgi:hypothetical protein